MLQRQTSGVGRGEGECAAGLPRVVRTDLPDKGILSRNLNEVRE